MTATDADDPAFGNNAKLIYSILQGEPYFSVEPKTGQISIFSLSAPRFKRVHTGGGGGDGSAHHSVGGVVVGGSRGLQTLGGVDGGRSPDFPLSVGWIFGKLGESY